MGLILLNGTAYSGYDEPPCVYSEEEREIGVWIDGKPLYQKTVDCGYLPNTTEKTVSHSIQNIDKIIKVDSIQIWSNNLYASANYNDINNSSYETMVLVDLTNVRLATKANSSEKYCYVTIQYTKTTDTPGSGKWASNGALAKHYSLQEQVIGTWIDGKPLYERVIYLNDLQINQNWTSTSYCEPIDKVVKADLIDSYNQHFTCEVGINESQTAGYYDILLSTRYPSGSNRTFNYLIIQYTKNTD